MSVAVLLRGAQRRLSLIRSDNVIVLSIPLEPARFASWCYQRGWRPKAEEKYARFGAQPPSASAPEGQRDV